MREGLVGGGSEGCGEENVSSWQDILERMKEQRNCRLDFLDSVQTSFLHKLAQVFTLSLEYIRTKRRPPHNLLLEYSANKQ